MNDTGQKGLTNENMKDENNITLMWKFNKLIVENPKNETPRRTLSFIFKDYDIKWRNIESSFLFRSKNGTCIRRMHRKVRDFVFKSMQLRIEMINWLLRPHESMCFLYSPPLPPKVMKSQILSRIWKPW